MGQTVFDFDTNESQYSSSLKFWYWRFQNLDVCYTWSVCKGPPEYLPRHWITCAELRLKNLCRFVRYQMLLPCCTHYMMHVHQWVDLVRGVHSNQSPLEIVLLVGRGVAPMIGFYMPCICYTELWTNWRCSSGHDRHRCPKKINLTFADCSSKFIC